MADAQAAAPADVSMSIPAFRGGSDQNAQEWLRLFETWISFKGIEGNKRCDALILHLRSAASNWFEALPAETKTDYARLIAAFKERYFIADSQKWMLVGRVWQHQTEGQSVDDFITQVEIAAAQVGLDEINTRYAAINGLLPPIRTFVLGRELTDLAAVRKWGKMAEMCEFDAQVRTKQGVHAITDNMEQMTAGRDEGPTSSANTYSRETTQTAGGPPRGNTGGRGRFGQRSTSYQPRQQYGQNQRQPGRGRPFSRGNGYPRNQGHWNQKVKPPHRTLEQGTHIGRVNTADLLILMMLGSVEQKGLHVTHAGNWVIYLVFACQANANKNHSNH